MIVTRKMPVCVCVCVSVHRVIAKSWRAREYLTWMECTHNDIGYGDLTTHERFNFKSYKYQCCTHILCPINDFSASSFWSAFYFIFFVTLFICPINVTMTAAIFYSLTLSLSLPPSPTFFCPILYLCLISGLPTLKTIN